MSISISLCTPNPLKGGTTPFRNFFFAVDVMKFFMAKIIIGKKQASAEFFCNKKGFFFS
jgi:hypothetical protein